jgi:hypothetical protein
MATTQLADIIEPRVFMRYQMKETEVKSALFTSGILRSDEQLSTFLSGGGKTVDVPFWNDLGDGTDPNIGNDNPASVAGTAKIGSGDDVAIRHNLISTLKGVFADNAANDGGNMRVVIGNDLASAVTDAERVSAEAVIDAAQTMGDSQEDLALLMMHSVIYTRLKKQNLIDFIPDSEGRVRFATYLGYRIVVDDNCPAVAGSNRILYSTYLVGMGAIAFAEVPPPMPVEVDREPSQGNGQGVDYLWTRRQYIMHPYGIKWTSSSMAGTSPTNAELATTANWDRVYTERKMIKLAELVTNG